MKKKSKKMSNTYRALLMAVYVFCCFGISDFAYAQGASEIVANCPNYAEENKIFMPMMKCVTDVVDGVAQTYLQRVTDILRDSVLTLMAIAVAIIGIRIATGATGKQPAREAVILIFKIAFISFFVLNLGIKEYMDYLKDFTGAISDIFINVLEKNFTHVFQGDTIDPDADGSFQQVTLPAGQEMWQQIDFLLQRIFGLGGDDTQLQEGMVGIAMVLVGLLTLGPIGGWVGIIIFFAVFTLIGAFAMAVFTYIVSMVAIMVLAAFSPLVIPLVLFGTTKSIFDNWLNQLISYALQPTILTAFLVFMIAVMQNGAVDMVTQYVDWHKSFSDPNNKTQVDVVAGADTQVKTSKEGVQSRPTANDLVTRFVTTTGLVPEPVDTSTTGVGTSMRIPAYQLPTEKNELMEFAINLILTIFLSYVMISFMHQLPQLVQELIGDKNIPNLVQQFGMNAFNTTMKAQEGIVAFMRQ